MTMAGYSGWCRRLMVHEYSGETTTQGVSGVMKHVRARSSAVSVSSAETQVNMAQ